MRKGRTHKNGLAFAEKARQGVNSIHDIVNLGVALTIDLAENNISTQKSAAIRDTIKDVVIGAVELGVKQRVGNFQGVLSYVSDLGASQVESMDYYQGFTVEEFAAYEKIPLELAKNKLSIMVSNNTIEIIPDNGQYRLLSAETSL